MVDICAQFPRLEEVNGVEVSNVDAPSVRLRALAPVLLNMQAKEADFHAVDDFKCKYRLGFVRETLRKTFWAIPEISKLTFAVYNRSLPLFHKLLHFNFLFSRAEHSNHHFIIVL
jgi:hypothetical protein